MKKVKFCFFFIFSAIIDGLNGRIFLCSFCLSFFTTLNNLHEEKEKNFDDIRWFQGQQKTPLFLVSTF